MTLQEALISFESHMREFPFSETDNPNDLRLNFNELIKISLTCFEQGWLVGVLYAGRELV